MMPRFGSRVTVSRGRQTRHLPVSTGFTLVELLVVIGIIALLIGILLPVLSRAWEQARIIKCQSNIRQIYHAVAMYCNDNGGRLPIPGMYTHVFPYYGVVVAKAGTYDYSDAGGRLMPYVANSPAVRQQVFVCPSDEPPMLAGAPGTWQPNPGHFRNFSYNFNINLLGQPTHKPDQEADDFAGIRITQIRHAEHKFLIYEQMAPRDATARAVIGNPDGTAPDGVLFLLTTRHLARCNIGFADGHAEQFERDKILPRVSSGFVVDLSYEDLLSIY